MKRRLFVKSVVAGSVALLGGVSAFQYYQQSSLEYPENLTAEHLTADDILILSVLIPVIVGDMKTPPDIAQTIDNIDQAFARSPKRTQNEIRELFDLLGSVFGRFILGGMWLNWQKSDQAQVSAFLSDWREHHLSLIQEAYIGLRLLITGSVYSEPVHWDAIGYPGPPRLFN